MTEKLIAEANYRPQFTPLTVLDEMIRQGWGDIPQTRIPPNWREYRLPKRQQIKAAILAAE